MSDYHRAAQHHSLAKQIYAAASLYLLDTDVPCSCKEIAEALQEKRIGTWVERPAIFGESGWYVGYSDVYQALQKLVRDGIADTGKVGPARFYWFRRDDSLISSAMDDQREV